MSDPMPDLGAAVTSEEAFDPAVKWFQKRLGMTRAQVDQMTLDARRKVFFVTGLSDLELIKSVQDSLARALEEGKTFDEWKAEVKEKKLFQGPEFTRRRLETIFRTNMQNAFATGRYMEMTSPAMLKRRPYWKFSAVRDGRTTSTCAAAHGTILPANHPWWKTHIPPLHFNCRSTIVPLSERRAKELGITKHPPPAPSALGFGNPPDGVPAAAKDMPTEAQREAAEKVSEEVQTAVEKRQNASAELREARHRRTVAAKEAKQARKEAVQAPPSEFKEKTKAADAAQQRKVAADRQVAQAERELQQANLTAEKAARKGQPGTWRLVPERLKRLAKGVAAGAARVLGNILGLFKRLKDAVLDGVPVLEGVTPDGQKIYFGRGDITRAPLMRYAGKSGAGNNERPIPLVGLDEETAADKFFNGDKTVARWWLALRKTFPHGINDVNYYKGKDFYVINESLRSGDWARKINSAHKTAVNNLQAMLSKSNSPKTLTLYRGNGKKDVLSKLFPGIEPIDKSSLESWKDAIIQKIKMSGTEGGVKTTDKAFVSTALTPKKAFDTEIKMKISVKKGQKGVAPIVGNSDKAFQLQQEILIEPNRTLLCRTAYIKHGSLWLDCELLD